MVSLVFQGPTRGGERRVDNSQRFRQGEGFSYKKKHVKKVLLARRKQEKSDGRGEILLREK